jgi:hypothetical protein
MKRPELVVLGVMFFAALLAFPAFRDVQMLQNLAIAVCTSLGININ